MMARKNDSYIRHSESLDTFGDAQFQVPQRTAVAQAITVALVAGVAPGTLLAQDDALDEITVTATKRAESVMDVPLAITAISGDSIRDLNLNDVKSLIHFTPGITGSTKDSFLDFVSVRGIRTIDYGNGGDPSVSIYKNGLYQGRTGSAVTSLFDLERAEILRGPQGFLFGRNSVSGAMNLITAKPEIGESGGFIELDAGERGHAVVEAAANVPVNDSFAYRVAAYHAEEDGYVKNLAGGPDLIGHQKTALRISTRYETENLTVDFMAEHEDRDQQGTVYRATGNGPSYNEVLTRINNGVPLVYSPDGLTVNNDNSLGSEDGGRITSFGLQIDYETSLGTFSSITGFKEHKYKYIEDYDATELRIFDYFQDQEGDYFEQEFRLTSNSEGPLSWYAGASFYKENIDTIFRGVQEEDIYCGAYWYYANEYYGASQTCENMFYYYNYWDAYNEDTYYCDYYLTPYFGTCDWSGSSSGLIDDRNRTIGKFTGYSAYLDLSYEFSDSFDMSFGVRYSYDEKDFSQESLPDPGGSLLAYKVQTGFRTLDGPVRDKQDWSKTTWRVVANWRPTDNSLIFGSVTTGYKPGGFSSFAITQTGDDPDSPSPWGTYVALDADKPARFEPETVTSYDIGYKGTIMDGRMQIGVSAFLYDYEDMQALWYDGAKVNVDNVGQVDGTGVEFDINTALTDNINVLIGGSWFDSEATGIQVFCESGPIYGDPRGEDACEGNSIPWAPEWTAFAMLKTSFPTANGEIFADLSWSWEEATRVDWADPSIVYQKLDLINQTDIAIGYRTENWRVSAYVENIFDEVWYDAAYPDDDPASPYVEHAFGPSRPLTAGVRFGYNW
jgi:iron complex outermembrane receptor protein